MRRPIGSFVLVVLLTLCAHGAGGTGTKRQAPVISPANAAHVRKLKELQRDVTEIVWGPRSWQVSLHGWEQPIEVLDAESFRPVRKIGANLRPIHFAVSPDGGTVALCENGTSVEIRRELRGKRVLFVETKDRQPGMAFSPDGKLLATGGYGTQTKLWEVATGRLVRSLETAPEGGLTVVFSPDGKLLAIGNRNGQTRLYEVATGKLLHILPRDMSQELKFSPDGRVLAVAYVDGSIGLWKVADGSLLNDRATGAKEVYSLDWSPRGDVLATSGLQGKIILWDPRNLSVLKDLEAPEWVIRVRFSPDGTRLLSAGGSVQAGPDRRIVVWGVVPGHSK
jgi:WD40 repeat protein